MTFDAAKIIINNLRQYKGQACKPYNSNVVGGQIVPIDHMAFIEYANERGDGEKRVTELFPNYNGDFTVIIIFEENWCYYDQFIEDNNIQF